MSTVRQRLLTCFQTIFPEQTGEELLSATPDSVTRWDSSNHFLLLQVVEEEFGVRVPESVGGELLSFSDWDAYLENHKPTG
jgi:hypothetical protein